LPRRKNLPAKRKKEKFTSKKEEKKINGYCNSALNRDIAVKKAEGMTLMYNFSRCHKKG
jgi:hypothetical protein